MPILQTYNKTRKAWVKFKFMKNGKVKFLDMKQRKPTVKFKGIKVASTSVKK